MEEILQLEISGKFNGRDATLSIGLDAESAFEIEEVDTDTPSAAKEDGTQSATADADVATQTQQTQPVSEEPESTPEPDVQPDDVPPEPVEAEPEPVSQEPEPPEESEEDDEPRGLEELFPTQRFDEEDIPPFTAGTKQFQVANMVFEGSGPVRVRYITDELQEKDPEGDWNDSKVTSHLYAVMKKEIIEREKDSSTGKWEYQMTDLGRAAIRYALRKDPDRSEDEMNSSKASA